jgi:hypothetical protein
MEIRGFDSRHPDCLWDSPSVLSNQVPESLSPGAKQPGHEPDHSPPSRSEVKNVWSYTSVPPICLGGVVLSLNFRDIYTFTFTIIKHGSIWNEWSVSRSDHFIRGLRAPETHSIGG